MNRKVGVILSYCLMFIEVLSTLFLTPFVIRSLGQGEYGVYRLATAVNAYLLLLDLGVGNATTRYIAKYKAENDKFSEKSFLGIATIYYAGVAGITIVSGIILILVFPNVFATGLTYDEIILGQKLLGITMLNSAITLGTTAYTNTIVAYEHFGVSKGVAIGELIIRSGLTLFVLKIGSGSVGLVSINLITTVICRAIFIIYVRIQLKLYPIFKGIKKGFVKEVFVYSSFVLLQMIATQLNQSVDQILLGMFVASSSAIIGVYAIGAQIVQYFISIGSAFKGVMMPGIVGMVSRKASDRVLIDEMIRIGRITYMILALLWIGFVICGKRFINLWAGAGNIEAYSVSVILMFAQMFLLTLSVGQYVLWALNEHKELAILKILVVICNIFLTIILINWKPLLGATIGTFISLILGDVVAMTFVYKKKLNLKIHNYYAKLLKGITVCMGISGMVGFITDKFLPYTWYGMIALAFVITFIYCVSMYLFGMNKYEKNLINLLINKVKGKTKE